jgi:predicted nucleotidyltransferase
LKIIALYEGGSKSYGLDTPLSDKDDRYIFINTDVTQIVGLNRHDHQIQTANDQDSAGWELRHFLNLLRRGNTQAVEFLFNEKWMETTSEFLQIQNNRNFLLDSHKLFSCLKGYSYSERLLVLGKKTGPLGSKRKEAVEKFGYSYKNLVQFMRLCMAGAHFFQTGIFPVNIRSIIGGDLLFYIKTHPEKFCLDEVIQLMDAHERLLIESYGGIKVVYTFNEKIANDLCFSIYYRILEKYNQTITNAKNKV